MKEKIINKMKELFFKNQNMTRLKIEPIKFYNIVCYPVFKQIKTIDNKMFVETFNFHDHTKEILEIDKLYDLGVEYVHQDDDKINYYISIEFDDNILKVLSQIEYDINKFQWIEVYYILQPL